MGEVWETIGVWIEKHQTELMWTAIVSGILLAVTMAVALAFVVRIPSDYFIEDSEKQSESDGQAKSSGKNFHPAVLMLWRVARNVFGWILILAGIVMLVAPGQGLATMFVGFVMVDFPGKARIQRRLIKLRSVHRTINWFRRKFDREPLELPD